MDLKKCAHPNEVAAVIERAWELERPGDGVDGEVATVIAKALDLIADGSHDAAWDLLVVALENATQAGFSSGFLRWAMALAAHGRRDFPAAMQHVLAALKLDPAAPVMLDTFRAIVLGIGSVLADPALDPANDRVPVLFSLLEQVGAVDAHALFTASLHHAAHRRLDRAAALAERLIDLEPHAAEVVRYAATLYRGMKHEDKAKEYEARAKLLDEERNVIALPRRRAQR